MSLQEVLRRLRALESVGRPESRPVDSTTIGNVRVAADIAAPLSLAAAFAGKVKQSDFVALADFYNGRD